MSKPKVVFIAGERQHAGKTVTSLGLISAITNHIDPRDIGYFKPVGQEMVTLANGERIDKDVRIVKRFTKLDMPDQGILSPVRVIDGVTTAYIKSDNPQELTAGYEKAVAKTMEYFSDKKLVIAEGTGHPGVGSVIGMSNARVANQLGAQILYLVGGGIGRTLDELEVDLSYFKHKKNQVAGVLFNKVLPKKVDKMKDVINEKSLTRIFPEWSPSLRVFGYLPTVKYLNNPSMQSIRKSFKDHRVIKGRCARAWHKSCRKVIIVSKGSDVFDPASHLQERDIAVINAGSVIRLSRIIEFNKEREPDMKIGGIILTCANHSLPTEAMVRKLEDSCIPTIAVEQDTADTDKTLYSCFRNTKLQLYDQVKHEKIVELFSKHFDTERFIEAYDL